MKLRRRFQRAASVGTCIWFLLCIAVASAQIKATDWKVYGYSKYKSETVALFYSAGEVRALPGGHVEIWTKALNQKDIEHAYESLSKAQQARLVEKIAAGYVPPYASITKVTPDQLIDLSASEEIANGSDIQPMARVLYELDCSDEVYRELSTHTWIGGKAEISDTVSAWHHVPPETPASSLLSLACPKS